MEGVTVGIRAFIAARLDEHEAAARAAAVQATGVEPLMDGTRWRVGGEADVYLDGRDSNQPVAVGPWGGGLGNEIAGHIARWDPIHVLRDIAAKRAILAAYDRAVARFGDALDSPADTDTDASAYSARAHMQLVLRLLAAIDEDHPGFSPAWKLEGS